jgi:DNA modification methylase
METKHSNSVDLVLADPPYEHVVDANWDKVDDYMKFSRRWLAEAVRVLRPGGALLIYGSPERTWIARLTVLLEDKFNMRIVQTLCWVYSQGGGSRVSNMNKLAVQHELLLWVEKPGGLRTFNAAECVEHYLDDERAMALAKGKGRVSESSLDRGRPPRSFLDFPRENSRSNERKYGKHPSMKPLALCEHLVKLYSNKDNVVMIPFAGSGSELLAASKLGRVAVGAETNSEYIDLMKRRMVGHGVEMCVMK